MEYFFKANQSSPRFTYQKEIDELLSSNNVGSSISQTTLSLVEALTKWMEPEIIYTEILHFLIRECNADRCQIIYCKEDTNEFEMRALSPGLEGEDFDFSRGILLESIKQNKPTLIENAVESTQFKHNLSVYGKIFLSVISVPLRIENEDKTIGAIYLDRVQVNKGVFRNKDLNNVLTLAKLISSVLWQQEKNKTFQFESKIRRLGMFVGNSIEMQNVYKQIENTSKVKLPVFIYGETGTGKELVAKSIHYISENKNNPFIAINCAALPRGLVESELFGHEKGSFTGAFERQGKFELADNGTLFLDEIAELSLENQAKILRAIEEKQIWRVGGKTPISINTRIITATHRNLKDEIAKGKFREDLYHRLNVLKIEIPPLRERVSDILPLGYYFLEKYCKEMNKEIKGFTLKSIEFLKTSQWVGNVRELENTIAKGVLNHQGKLNLDLKKFFSEKEIEQTINNITISSSNEILVEGQSLNSILESTEKQVVIEALTNSNWNLTKTAKLLNIGRSRLYRILEKHNLPSPS